jgi:Raf kinase inhibitor-like YbhB/YbcL family protein
MKPNSSSASLFHFGTAFCCATLVALAISCSSAEGEKNMTIQITSSAFAQGHPIPKKYTGEGADVSPPLVWSGVPDTAKELALICDDPDAPRPEPWVHWVIYKIPVGTKGLPEGLPRKATLKEPAGAVQGKNSWTDSDVIGYRGPLPPKGHGVHHYHFKLYALDAAIDAEPGLEKNALLAKIKGHILAEGELVGTYQR